MAAKNASQGSGTPPASMPLPASWIDTVQQVVEGDAPAVDVADRAGGHRVPAVMVAQPARLY